MRPSRLAPCTYPSAPAHMSFKTQIIAGGHISLKIRPSRAFEVFFGIYRKCRCQKTPQTPNSDKFCVRYGLQKFSDFWHPSARDQDPSSRDQLALSRGMTRLRATRTRRRATNLRRRATNLRRRATRLRCRATCMRCRASRLVCARPHKF